MRLNSLSKKFIGMMERYALVDGDDKFVWGDAESVAERRRVAWAKGYMKVKGLEGVVIGGIPLVVPAGFSTLPAHQQIPVLIDWGWTDGMIEEEVDIHVLDFLEKRVKAGTRKTKLEPLGIQLSSEHVAQEQKTGAAAPEETVMAENNNTNNNNTNTNTNTNEKKEERLELFGDVKRSEVEFAINEAKSLANSLLGRETLGAHVIKQAVSLVKGACLITLGGGTVYFVGKKLNGGDELPSVATGASASGLFM